MQIEHEVLTNVIIVSLPEISALVKSVPCVLLKSKSGILQKTLQQTCALEGVVIVDASAWAVSFSTSDLTLIK